MFRYLVSQVGNALISLFGVVTLVFLLMRVLPGDPARLILGQNATPAALQALRVQLGLNQPILVQYVDFLYQMLQGHFGNSYISGLPVTELISQVLPYTIELAFGGLIVSLLFGIPLGVYAALHRDTNRDLGLTSISVFGISVPSFWLGAIFVLLFALKLPIFPATGAGQTYNLSSSFVHLVLPSLTLGLPLAGLTMRMTRSSVLEVLHQDFIRSVRARGVTEQYLIYRHALKNALIPVVTIIGVNVRSLIAGAVVVEIVFARPGLGSLLVDAISSRDYPIVQGAVFVFALIVVLSNFLVDISYSYIDPRIKK